MEFPDELVDRGDRMPDVGVRYPSLDIS